MPRFAAPVSQETLLDWVRDFVTRPQVESDRRGGWAPVSDADLGLLDRIIENMICIHWAHDSDGDRPIESYLNDRTQFEPWPWVPVPYWHGAGDIEEFVTATMRNAQAATARFALALEFAESRRAAAAKADREAAAALSLADLSDASLP